MNVPGTKAQESTSPTSSAFPISQWARSNRELIHGSAMSPLDDFVDNRLAADAGLRRFARAINVGDHHVICVLEGAAKVAAERFRARIAMGLKHRQDSFATGRPCSFQRSADLRWMMRVIVNQ
jgi:hypothetical protein